jgi:heme-binding NEAT domain protein
LEIILSDDHARAWLSITIHSIGWRRESSEVSKQSFGTDSSALNWKDMHSFSTYGHHCSTLDYSVGSGSDDIVSAMQNYSEKDIFLFLQLSLRNISLGSNVFVF